MRALGANVGGDSVTESAGELILFLFGVLAIGVDERAVGVTGSEEAGVENNSANDVSWTADC